MAHERNEEMREHLEAWRASGLTQSEYCQQNNIKTHIFTYYKSRLGYGQPKIRQNTIVPIQIVSEQNNSSGISIQLAEDLTILIAPGFEPQTLQQVINLLR